MVALNVLLGNLVILLLMLAFAVAWNGLAWLRQRGRVSKVLHAYAPNRAEWSAYYWRRMRRYLVSYMVILAILFLFPALIRRRLPALGQLASLLSVLPGLLAYFVLGGLVPARFAIYPEGFSCYALVPMLPGQRDRGARGFSVFRVGLTRWRDYHDALPRGEVLIIKGEVGGAELVIPRGQRDVLLGLAREGLKRAREERRQTKRAPGRKA